MSWRKTRNVFTFLDAIRARPSLYSVHDLKSLEIMVGGYYSGLGMYGIVEDVPNMESHFGTWLYEETKWSTSCGWASAITEHSRKRPPLEVFFKLVDRYRKLRPVTVCSTKLGPRNAPTGKRAVVGLNGRIKRPTRIEIVRYTPTRMHFLRFHYGRRMQSDSVLMDEKGSHATSLRYAKKWVAEELQTTDSDWTTQSAR